MKKHIWRQFQAEDAATIRNICIKCKPDDTGLGYRSINFSFTGLPESIPKHFRGSLTRPANEPFRDMTSGRAPGAGPARFMERAAGPDGGAGHRDHGHQATRKPPMRKTLLTTTALAMGAGGIAAAQEAEPELGIALSGAAEMGIAGSKGDNTRFHTDIQATFTMSGATDGGLTYGTAIDLSEVSDEVDGTDHATGNDDAHGGIAINIAGPFGTLTMGDTDGAFDWAMTETAVGGSLRDNHTGHPGYNGNGGLDGTHDGQILSYTHTIGGIGIAVSAEVPDGVEGSPSEGSAVFGVGAKYSMPMAGGASVGVGVGYQSGDKDMVDYGKDYADLGVTGIMKPTTGPNANLALNRFLNDNRSAIGASVNMASGGGLSAIVNWSQTSHEGSRVNRGNNNTVIAWDSDITVTHFGLGVGYTAGPVTVGANWGRNETEVELNRTRNGSPHQEATREISATGIGLAANYDLGGGASLQLGVGDGTTETTDEPEGGSSPGPESKDHNNWSLGLAFSF